MLIYFILKKGEKIKMKNKKKKTKFPLAKAAALLSAAMLAVSSALLTGCDNNDSSSASSSSTADSSSSVAETAAATTQAATEPATTAHVSPTETVSFSMGSEKSDINEIMDYDGNKTYKANMADFALPEGSKPDSFVFVFYAEDGSSNISSYKGGVGISVDEGCSAATDKGWYQSDDFEMDVNSAYLEVKWDVPSDIRDYVNITDSGSVQIGYWWGGVQKLRLSSIICNYSVSAEIPVDGTNTVDVNKTLTYGKEAEKTVNLPLSDMIPENAVPQYFEFNVSGGSSMNKYAGAFGITVDDSCPDKTDKSWYQSKNIAVMTDSSSATLYWLVPENIKEYIKSDGEVMLGYWWSENDSVDLTNVTVKYSTPNGSSSTSVSSDSKSESSSEADKSNKTDSTASTGSSSAEIVKNMKIGWNLGNTLDCADYESYATDGETAWGNPKTTKEMIDTVKAAGFNAVRVPVTWAPHLNGDTIDSAWLDRVNEVIDYVIDNGMYAIVNVHHDDTTWLVPDKAHESSAKDRLVKIWQQLAERFKSYDEHLLFEGMNEPRVIGSADEWTHGTADEREVINNLFAAFVETVRASGGNNATRTLIVTGNAAAMDETAVKGIKVPDDDHVIVSIHSYHPYDFALNDKGTSEFKDSDKSQLDSEFDLLKSTFIDKGVPVIIGEFGSENKNNIDDRLRHMEYYVKAAKQRGITCFIWDNNVKDGNSAFGLLDRKNCSWYFKELVDTAVKAAQG